MHSNIARQNAERSAEQTAEQSAAQSAEQSAEHSAEQHAEPHCRADCRADCTTECRATCRAESSQDGPKRTSKLIPKSFQNVSQVSSKRFPTWLQNVSKMRPLGIPKPEKVVSKNFLFFSVVFGSTFDENDLQKVFKNRSNIDQKYVKKQVCVQGVPTGCPGGGPGFMFDRFLLDC